MHSEEGTVCLAILSGGKWILFSDFERLQGPVIALFSDLYVLLLPEVKWRSTKLERGALKSLRRFHPSALKILSKCNRKHRMSWWGPPRSAGRFGSSLPGFVSHFWGVSWLRFCSCMRAAVSSWRYRCKPSCRTLLSCGDSPLHCSQTKLLYHIVSANIEVLLWFCALVLVPSAVGRGTFWVADDECWCQARRVWIVLRDRLIGSRWFSELLVWKGTLTSRDCIIFWGV